MTCLVKACMWRRLRFWFKIYEAKHHIDIKVDMDEMDVTGAEKKLHTSRLNIIQQRVKVVQKENALLKKKRLFWMLSDILQ